MADNFLWEGVDKILFESFSDDQLKVHHQKLIGDAYDLQEQLNQKRSEYQSLETEIQRRRSRDGDPETEIQRRSSLRLYVQKQFPNIRFTN